MLTCSFPPAPVTWLQGHLAASSGRSVLGSPLYSPKRQAAPAFLTLSPGHAGGLLGPTGPSASLTKGLSLLLLKTPLPGPGRSLFRAWLPAPGLRRGSRACWFAPEAQARRVGEIWGWAAGGMEASPAARRRCALVPAARCAPGSRLGLQSEAGSVMMRRTAETPAP